MLYYRYRPFSEFSLKELMYDELFFASAEECNDPHECWDFLQFPPDYDKWHRLLELAWKNADEEIKTPFYDLFCEYLVTKSPITVCELLSKEFFHPLLERGNFKSPSGYTLLINLINYLNTYLGEKRYFVSFSKAPDNYLMWSHYANRHNGYCLIFKPLKGCLYQANNRMRENINIERGNSSKLHVTEHIGPKFHFCDVIYEENSAIIDPFFYFPQYVSQYKITNERERHDFFEKLERHYLEKGACWEYEHECRLLLPNPMSWITGGKS